MPENSAPSTDVGDPIPEASDADSDTLTYFMDGTDEAHFSFNDFRQILTFEDLDHETKNTYSVTVTADDGNGGTDTIAVTINVTDVNEKSATPAKPTLAAVDGSSTTLTASWEKPDLDGGPDITGYALQYRAGAAGSWEDFAHGDTAVTTTITGLTADTEYQAQVRAKNGETDSDWSDASDAVSTNAEETSDAPTVTAVTVTSTPALETDTYGAGETIEISVTFSEAVSATSATDFVLNAGGARRAPLLLGNETETLVFGYTVAGGDEDNNGIWIGDQDRTLVGNRNGTPQNGAITSVATGAAADLDHDALGTQSGHKVDGSRGVAIVEVLVTSRPDEGDTYGLGETIEISLTFSEAVNATAGTDFVLSVSGGKRAGLLRGSGTTTLVFGYTVAPGDVDDNGIWIGDQDDTLVGDRGGNPQTGEITSVATGAAADLTHGELGGLSDHKVDGLLGVDNNPPVFTEGDSTTRTVAESSLPAAGNGIEVGAPVVATDADDDTLTYTLKGDDRNSFRFDTDTGQIWTLPPAAFAYPDYSDGDTYQVEVEARDGRDGDDTIAVTINITDEPTEDGDGPTEDGDGPTEDGDEPTEDGDEPTEDDGPPEGDDDDDDDDGPGPGPDSDPDPDPEPDLVVDAASVSDDSPVAGGAFTFSATVRNAGDTDSPATTLRYYRSTDATISTADSEEGNDAVGALAASASSRESVELTAPSTPGTYYYGACVDAVSGEADTTNNCSTAVQVDVSEAEPVPALPLLGQLLLALGLAAGGAGLARRRRAPTA